MTRRKLLGAGIAASSAAAGWLDYALFPTLGVFAGIMAYAVLQRRKPPSYEGKRAR